MKSLQATLVAATRPAPPVSWRTAEGWAAVKTGMSRAQVVEILGDPQSTDAVMDRQTLFYKEGANPVDSVILVDDRVSEVTSQRFRINTHSGQWRANPEVIVKPRELHIELSQPFRMPKPRRTHALGHTLSHLKIKSIELLQLIDRRQ